MAIINCPECGAKISDRAEKCPKCAFPISGQQVEEKVHTVQLRSKKLKIQILLAGLMFIIGVIFLMLTESDESGMSAYFGGLLTFLGIIWFIVVKVIIWWNHK